MLKVVDDGVVITLAGKDKNPLFIMTAGLIVVAILVAIVAMTMSVKVTIGAFFGLACLIFAFNVYKNNRATHSTISTGNITIKNRQFIGNGQSVKLSDNALITLNDGTLTISDLGRVWHITGFEADKESHIAKSVLEGKALEKRERAIRIL